MSSHQTSEETHSRRPRLPPRPAATIAIQGTSSSETPRKEDGKRSSTSKHSTDPDKSRSGTLKSLFTRSTSSSSSPTQISAPKLPPKTPYASPATQARSLPTRKSAVAQTPVQLASKRRFIHVPHGPTTPKEELKWRQNRCNYFCRLLRQGWTIKNAAAECDRIFGHFQPAKDRHTGAIKKR